MVASRSIVGIQPRAPFYPLFESLKNQAGNKITVFTQGTLLKKQTGSDSSSEPGTVLVETGEESALSSLRVESLVKERRVYGITFLSSPENFCEN